MTGSLASTIVRDGITVASLNGDIDLSNAAELQEELLRSVNSDSRGLLVDLTAVRYVDSAGVRTFFDIARELDVSRQVLGIVVPLQSPIRRLVKLTCLDEVAVVGATVEECISSLAT